MTFAVFLEESPINLDQYLCSLPGVENSCVKHIHSISMFFIVNLFINFMYYAMDT